MEIDPKTLDPELCYKMVIGCVVPRPIAVVSTVSVEGHENVAPFSYFTVASHNPLSLAFTVGGPKPDGAIKDTLRNAQIRRGRRRGRVRGQHSRRVVRRRRWP